MPVILNIDTAQENAYVCINKDGLLIERKNADQKDHASWLHVAIREIMDDSKIELADLDAVAVTNGPGSYTGLRVGLAAAKGICYALRKPLITINTLEVMAVSVKHEAEELICPVIDARRMEVFTAIYDKELKVVEKPVALILNNESFSDYLANRNLMFIGSGVEKLKHIISSQRATFSNIIPTGKDLSFLSVSRYQLQLFSELAYAEPFYLKEFQSVQK